MADSNILQLMQYVTDQGEAGRKSGLQKLMGQAYNAPEAQRQQILGAVAAKGEPGMAMGAQKAFNAQDDDIHDRIIQRAGMVAALYKTNPQMAQAAYQGLPQMAAQAGFGQVPLQLDDKVARALDDMSKAALSAKAGGVQSTYIDGQGNRVAIMRDGRSQVIGQNAPNNQIIDTGNGFYGVNKGNLQAAPVNIGGQPQQAPQAPGEVPFSIDPSLPQDVQASIRANPQAGSADGITAPINAAQQLRSAPKPQAPSALDERIAKARQMGATPEQIKQMVVGSAGQASAPDVPGDTSKTGNAYLSTLPQQTASQVRALADGRMQFPSGTALKSPYWQGMLSAVSQYDPNFDAVNYNARSNTRKAFTSGKEAQTVNALNTVAEHLGTFSDNAAALHNTGFPLYNRIKNFALQESGDPRIAAFNTNKKAVADEVAKVWRATGGSEADIQENLKNLDGAQSPEQLNAAIGTLTQLIYGKVAALQDQYASGMGTTQTPRPLVSKEAQAAFDKTLQRMSGGAPARSGGPKVIRYDAQGNRIP